LWLYDDYNRSLYLYSAYDLARIIGTHSYSLCGFITFKNH
jgi:hypothetical protein